MEQTKSKLTGLSNIYGFTVVQSMKSKTMKVVTLILCLIALVSVPIVTLVNGGEETGETSIKKVKVVDMTGMELLDDLSVLKSIKVEEQASDTDKFKDSNKTSQKKAEENKTQNTGLYQNIEYEPAQIDFSGFDEKTKKKDIYEFEKDADYVYMQIFYAENTFHTEIIYSDKTKVKEKDVKAYAAFVDANFRRVIVNHTHLTEKQQQIVDSTEVVRYQEDLEKTEKPLDLKENNSVKEKKYWIIYTATMIVLMALSFGGERVAMNILTDKASKVMEYLLTSVKPMAVVLGKIGASITLLLIQLFLVLISFVGSIILNGMLFSDNHSITLPSFLQGVFNMDNFSGINAGSILLSVLIFVGGFLFYGLVAGLAGASVSKLEEITEGVKIYSLLLIISAYVVLFAVVQGRLYEGASIVKYVTILLPVTSIYLVPALLVTGYMTWLEGLGSLAAMAVSLVFMIKFVSDVYESMVYYSGAPMKLKDIIQISKQKKMAGGKSK